MGTVLFFFSDFFANFQTVDVRQHNIENYHIEIIVLHQFDSRATVKCNRNLVSKFHKTFFDKGNNARFIFDKYNFFHKITIQN